MVMYRRSCLWWKHPLDEIHEVVPPPPWCISHLLSTHYMSLCPISLGYSPSCWAAVPSASRRMRTLTRHDRQGGLKLGNPLHFQGGNSPLRVRVSVSARLLDPCLVVEAAHLSIIFIARGVFLRMSFRVGVGLGFPRVRVAANPKHQSETPQSVGNLLSDLAHFRRAII